MKDAAYISAIYVGTSFHTENNLCIILEPKAPLVCIQTPSKQKVYQLHMRSLSDETQ